MPYGVRKDIDGQDVDFDRVYESVIQPAVTGAGLACIRCDDLLEPGWIPARMLKHILEDRVAVVDTSTWNANVFYELGVRHALKKSVTVLIRRDGTSSPFNIQGLSSVSYGTTPDSAAAAIAGIKGAITSGLEQSQEHRQPGLPGPAGFEPAGAAAQAAHQRADLRVCPGEQSPEASRPHHRRSRGHQGWRYLGQLREHQHADGPLLRALDLRDGPLPGRDPERRRRSRRGHDRQRAGGTDRVFDQRGAGYGLRHQRGRAAREQRRETYLPRRLRAGRAQGRATTRSPSWSAA